MIVEDARHAVAQRSRSGAVGHTLRREIVLGLLAAGEPLRELDLAQRFGVAQGTIREALMHLSEEGLVMRRARRDTHISPAGSDDVRELLHIRHEIECRAALRLASTPNDHLLKALEKLLQSMRLAALQEDEYALLEYDCQFHLLLFQAATMPVVEPVLARCLVHTQRFKVLNSKLEDRDLMATANRHVAIIEAVAARDPQALSAALSHHISTIVDLGPRVIGAEA